jgi:hypothetical protein
MSLRARLCLLPCLALAVSAAGGCRSTARDRYYQARSEVVRPTIEPAADRKGAEQGIAAAE